MPSDVVDGLDTVSVTLRLVSPSTASSSRRRAARQRRDGMPSDVANGLDAVSITVYPEASEPFRCNVIRIEEEMT